VSPPEARIILEEPSPAISEGRLVEAVGVEVRDGDFIAFIPAGTDLPTEKTERFSNTDEGQSFLEVRLYRGNASRTEHCTPLGVFAMTGFAPVGPREVALDVTLVAREQRLELRVVDRRDGRPLQVLRVNPSGREGLVH
jgi:hypothetical protein